MKGIAVIGCGNTLMKDDGIGVYVVREIKKRNVFKGIDIIDVGTPGIDLIYLMSLYAKIVIVDAMKSGIKVGSVKIIDSNRLSSLRKLPVSLHGLDLSLVIEIAKETGIKVSKIKIIGIEVNEIDSPKEGLSDDIKKKFNIIVEEVVEILRREGLS